MSKSGKKIGIFKVLQSIIAALFGIQSQNKMQEDCSYNRPAIYILAGIISLILIIVSLWLIVKAII